MESMSSRLKSLGFGTKRKSSVNIKTTNHLSPATTTTTTNGTTNGTTPTPPPNSSQTSLMNPQPNPAGRPPSYSYNVAGRPTSPLPPAQAQLAHHPPPIDTTTQRFPASHPPMAPPQPPGYGGYSQHPQAVGAPHGMAQYTRPAEVDGGGRSKAQLIVGIDFVSAPFEPRPVGLLSLTCSCQGTTFSGVAFAFATNTEAKEDIITEWPGAGNQTKQKVKRNYLGSQVEVR